MYYSDGGYQLVKDRIARERSAARQRSLARMAEKRPRLRARAARGLFALAMAVENEEAWRAVWDRLSAPR